MRKALGKGLDLLIPITKPAPPPEEQAEAQIRPTAIPIDKIRANRFQPRKNFDQEKLRELAESIKEHGLAQPIIVSQDEQNGGYELIAGERRLRACELAGFKEVEAIIRAQQTDKQRLAISLVENLQREDLNAVEAALGYLRLMKEFQISQTDLSQVVGKSKSAISNTLRLLDLPDNIQKAIQAGQITEGHARAILMADDPAKQQHLLKQIIAAHLSVREAEDLARTTLERPETKKNIAKSKTAKSADIVAAETSLQHSLGTKVEIRTKKDNVEKGSITIHYYSLNDFDKYVKMLIKQ